MARKKEIKELLNRVLNDIKLSEKEEEDLYSKVEEFLSKLKDKIKKEKFKADVFLGGSVAKKTLIKKHDYDVDIFVRFNKKTKEDEINNLIKKLVVLDGFRGEIVKGSRDYIRFRDTEHAGKMIFEVVPIIKITMPKNARNVTDLSVFHVNSIEKCIKKNKKLSDDIKLAKAFIYASGCYGAESYIMGFSGYGIELLTCYYKNFLKFIESMAESKDRKERLVIDPGKHYKSRKEVLESMNEAKLSSPIVLVDPTFKERNALAALSEMTLKKFQDYCKKFLKNPKEDFFKPKKIDEEELKERARQKGLEYAKIKAITNKQAGDIAGSKLLKFFRYLTRGLERYFEISEKKFEYSGEDYANFYFMLKSRKELLIKGPPIISKENVEKFKAKHKENFVKEERVYAKESIELSPSQFFMNFQNENKKFMLDMGIIKINLE